MTIPQGAGRQIRCLGMPAAAGAMAEAAVSLTTVCQQLAGVGEMPAADLSVSLEVSPEQYGSERAQDSPYQPFRVLERIL